MLWLALQLPQLPLEALGYADEATAIAITEHQRIPFLNDAAKRAGLQAHMSPSEARAVSRHIQLPPRQRQEEARTLRHLADWAYQFSAHVSPRPPDGLLLEIGGSLRLFGGLGALRQHITDGLDALGHRYRQGVAPTPTASWFLALAGDATPISKRCALRERLACLPCHVLELPAEHHQALAGLGLRTLGDCLALPRRDLARRFGRELLLQLEHALGERPEPRQAHQPPTRFHRQLDLPAQAHDTRAVAFALQRLLGELTGLLRGLDGGAQTLELELLHARQTASRFRIGLRRPSRDPEHLLSVCQHRLERQELAAPVIGLSLRVEQIQPLLPEPGQLLPDPAQLRQHQRQHLTERLGARLGEHAVTGLATAADHRPEYAWSHRASNETVARAPPGERPLWLLPRPTPLGQQQGLPCWHGPLTLERGPERIETGWWDGHDIARDYYQARAPQGSRLWIFRERRRKREWFLHGFFG
ncbi:DNA polymerase Y family protein [Aquisalimonas sp.]|uniref:Y-family DNA polymerase n=1 Tax=Aquisalimonas sp. TaxID=1872621 RepID=UPI0025BEC0F6|nr:DNA polymerase Y family protein [Aquisalimonas sp.]